TCVGSITGNVPLWPRPDVDGALYQRDLMQVLFEVLRSHCVGDRPGVLVCRSEEIYARCNGERHRSSCQVSVADQPRCDRESEHADDDHWAEPAFPRPEAAVAVEK